MNLKGTRNVLILAGLLALAKPGPVKAASAWCGNYNGVYGSTFCCVVFANCCTYVSCINGQYGGGCGTCNYA